MPPTGLASQEKLTLRQWKALQAVIRCSTIKAAAEECKMSTRELGEYMREPVFVSALQTMRREIAEQSVSLVHSGMSSAIESLQVLLQNKDPEVALRASEILTEVGLRVIQIRSATTDLNDIREEIRRMRDDRVNEQAGKRRDMLRRQAPPAAPAVNVPAQTSQS